MFFGSQKIEKYPAPWPFPQTLETNVKRGSSPFEELNESLIRLSLEPAGPSGSLQIPAQKMSGVKILPFEESDRAADGNKK